MRVSLSWLADFVNLQDLTPEQVAETLTAVGFEVERMERQTPFTGDVVVGEILTAAPHPNADSLRLCSVQVGEAEPLPIVCGAPNARAGLKVVVAKIGASLPGDFKIKKSKIRGEVSAGMMCSAKELAISDEHAGIIELPADALVGAPAAALLGLGETIFEVNVTPNRGDALGVVGLARDLAAKLGRPLKAMDLSSHKPPLSGPVKVEVQILDDQFCPRFVALPVRGVKVIPSPPWMQKRLIAAGMRPIDLVVDATNYAMLETAQPVHAYDERHVGGLTLAVRPADAGEVLTTLDGSQRLLEAGDVLICDRAGDNLRPIGLAGIMGGQSSEVRADTQGIIIEVATFNAQRIRRTGRRLGLHTEASHRFERGTDVDQLPQVALRVFDLLCRGAAEAGEPAPVLAGPLVDCYPGEPSKRVIALRLKHARHFLGLPQLTREEVIARLDALGFDLLDGTDDRLLFEVPFFRHDMEREVDLIEEVGRLHGFERIPYQLPVMNIRPTPEQPLIDFQEVVRTVAADLGLRETVSFPFVAKAETQALRLPDDHPLYPSLTLANPISETHDQLQSSLLPGLLRAVVGNRRRGESGARLFECGRASFAGPLLRQRLSNGPYRSLKSLGRPGKHLTSRAKSEDQRPVERLWLAGILDQPYGAQEWQGPAVPATFYHGKALVAGILAAVGIGAVEYRPEEPGTWPFLHPGAHAAVLANGKLLGYVGELHPESALLWDLDGDAAAIVFELDVEALLEARGTVVALDPDATRFPPVTRDLALVVDRTVTHHAVEQAVKRFKGRRHLRQSRLFDVFTGGSLPTDKKSMAYAFTFQSPERTLTDKDVDGELSALLNWLTGEVGAVLRS